MSTSNFDFRTFMSETKHTRHSGIFLFCIHSGTCDSKIAFSEWMWLWRVVYQRLSPSIHPLQHIGTPLKLAPHQCIIHSVLHQFLFVLFSTFIFMCLPRNKDLQSVFIYLKQTQPSNSRNLFQVFMLGSADWFPLHFDANIQMQYSIYLHISNPQTVTDKFCNWISSNHCVRSQFHQTEDSIKCNNSLG